MLVHRLLRAMAIFSILLTGPVALAQEDASPEDGRVEDGGSTLPDARQADALSNDSGLQAPSCPPGLSALGECDGDVVRYCEINALFEERLVEVDCSNPLDYLYGGPDVTCGLLDCEHSACSGHWCVAKEGSTCDQLGCDVGLEMGCLDGLCAPSTPCSSGDFEESCEASVLTYCQNVENNIDCSAGDSRPYTCEIREDGRDACVGLAGAACHALTGPYCASGLLCVAERCVIDDSPADAGESLDAAEQAEDASAVRSDAAPTNNGEDPADSCLCHASSSESRWWIFASGAVLLFLHRRRRLRLR